MKKLVLFFALFSTTSAFTQTYNIENEIFNKAIADKKWEVQEMQERGKAWKQLRDNYPVIPWDTVQKAVVFEKIITFPGITKVQAFKRCKEWASLHFNKLDAVIDYEDIDAGKLILEGYVNISHSKSMKNIWGNVKSTPSSSDLYFSLMITVIDGKAKISYHNLRFRHYVAGYFSASTYIPSEYVTNDFNNLFPIVLADVAQWNDLIEMARNSLMELNNTAPAIEKYINSFSTDYRF